MAPLTDCLQVLSFVRGAVSVVQMEERSSSPISGHDGLLCLALRCEAASSHADISCSVNIRTGRSERGQICVSSSLSVEHGDKRRGVNRGLNRLSVEPAGSAESRLA